MCYAVVVRGRARDNMPRAQQSGVQNWATQQPDLRCYPTLINRNNKLRLSANIRASCILHRYISVSA